MALKTLTNSVLTGLTLIALTAKAFEVEHGYLFLLLQKSRLTGLHFAPNEGLLLPRVARA
jgi:hypothetical protein